MSLNSKKFYEDRRWQSSQVVGVLGATSLVGSCLLPQLSNAGWQVIAFSRIRSEGLDNGIAWRRLPQNNRQLWQYADQMGVFTVAHWFCLAPIWVLPDYFSLLEKSGVRRVVALSSTSFYTKQQSSDAYERAVAVRLAKSEQVVRKWAEDRGIEWVILRPTLIYGFGKDKNISEIVRFIRRFGFFPVFGKALGLRQPIHAQDVANACLEVLQNPVSANKLYAISGGETLTYRDMVLHIFGVLGRTPRLVTLPLAVFQIAITLLRLMPRYRYWSAAMVERMNMDLVVNGSEATPDLAFSPRKFALSREDFPQ